MTRHEYAPLPEGPLNVDTEQAFMKLKMRLQRDLLGEYLEKRGITESHTPEGIELSQKWVDTYSKKFRDIFHRKVASDPHFKEDAETIPEAVFDEIKGELYHDDATVHPEDYFDEELLKKTA